MRTVPLALLLLSGCLDNTPPTLAPDALDDNLRWTWRNADTADDASLRDAASKLATAGKAETRTTPLKGQARLRLEAEDVQAVGLGGNDPSAARGLLIVNPFDCTLSRLQAILSAGDQASQYPDVYKSYARTFRTDQAAFLSGSAQRLDWDVTLKAALPVEDVYESRLRGGLRRVKGEATEATHGDFLVARTWLTAPAAFSAGSTSYFKQDYQVEIFWEQSPGKIFHAYGVWREIKVGSVNLTIEDDGFAQIVLDNLVKWDEQTARLCAQGG